MPLIDAYLRTVTQNYFRFDGRMHRAEFWWFVLANLLIFFTIAIIAELLTDGMTERHSFVGGLFIAIYGIYSLAMVLPSLGAQVRRFHDVDLSGWLVLLNLIPYLGGLIVLILLAFPAKPGGAKYGPCR